MKSIFTASLVLAIILCAATAVGQAPTPTPTPDPEAIEANVGIHVEPFSEMVKLSGKGGTATVGGVRVPVLPKYSVVISQWMVPNINSTYTFAEVEWRERVDHIFKSKSFLIPLSAVQVWARGGIGGRRTDGAGAEPAYTAQAGAAIAIGKVSNGILVINIRGGYIGSSNMSAPGSHLRFGSTGDAGIGLGLKF